MSFNPGSDQSTIIIGSIHLLGIVMIVFTFYGGIEAVIWVEVVQLVIYIGGAIAAAVVLISNIDGGFFRRGRPRPAVHKFDVSISISIFTKTYTFWGGLLGGCFLTMSTHGTDQYLVQRYLCTDKPRRYDGIAFGPAVVLAQFIGFLFVGVMLFAFYAPYTAPEYSQIGVEGSKVTANFPFLKGDQVFPNFITEHCPRPRGSGRRGHLCSRIVVLA